MPLILRSVKGSKLNIAEMDGNLLFLVSTLSSSLIQVTGSSFDASNTPITSSFFVGDARYLTNVTASFVTASNVYGPHGSNSVLSSSYAVSASRSSTSSYALTINPVISGALDLSGSLAINGVLVTTAIQVGGNNISVGGSDTQIQFNSGSVFSGSNSLIYNYTLFSLQHGNNTSAFGQYSHAEGYLTQTVGDYSHAEGTLTTASGNYSHAEGDVSQALGYASHAEGAGSIAELDYSHAEGSSTRAIGVSSHTEGYYTSASGDYSHAEGYSTKTNSSYSHAEGSYTIASGEGSHAEGNNTVASGSYSHTEGSSSLALGIGSHAEGYLTTASSAYSHAGGYGTVANYTYQTVVGQFNDTLTPKSTSPFVVGNGANASSRKTAFAVTSNSTVLIATQSAAPAYAGEEGEMVPVWDGTKTWLYVYIRGGWKSTLLT